MKVSVKLIFKIRKICQINENDDFFNWFDFNVVWMLEWDEKWKVYLLDHSLNWIG